MKPKSVKSLDFPAGSSRRPDITALRGLLAGVVLVAALVVAGRAGADDSLYTVAKLSVDVSAKDAVAAKEKAMSDAQRQAFQVVLKRLIPDSAYPKLATLAQQDVEELVDNVSVDREQMSTTRYIATFDVSFNAQAIRQLLASYGIGFSETRAPLLSIVPIMLDGGAVKPEGSEGWQKAWSDLDLSHGLVPANILPPRPDLDAAKLKAILGGDEAAVADLRNAYGGVPLVLAVGEVQNGTFVTRLAGVDDVGPINFGRSDKLAGSDVKDTARNAAEVALGIIEDRWKVKQAPQGQSEQADQQDQQQGPTTEPQQTKTSPAEVPRNVVADVEFSGLKDWQDIRTRLVNVPGVQALEVNSLSARGASITFDYAGSLGTLQKVLEQNGFSFENREDSFVLRSH